MTKWYNWVARLYVWGVSFRKMFVLCHDNNIPLSLSPPQPCPQNAWVVWEKNGYAIKKKTLSLVVQLYWGNSLKKLLKRWKCFLGSLRRWEAGLGVQGFCSEMGADLLVVYWAEGSGNPRWGLRWHVRQCAFSPHPIEKLCWRKRPHLEPVTGFGPGTFVLLEDSQTD